MGTTRKSRVYQNVDDQLTIDLFKLGTDGSLTALANKIEIDLLQPTSVLGLIGVDPEGASPDFSREEFLSHAQTRINDELNAYVYNADGETLSDTGASALGVEGRLFTRTLGSAMPQIVEEPEVIEILHAYPSADNDATDVSATRYLSYSYFGDRPNLSVYDKKENLVGLTESAIADDGNAVTYDNTQNTLTINVPTTFGTPSSSLIRLVGPISDPATDFDNHLNGRELRVFENTAVVDSSGGAYRTLRIDTSGLSLPESGFTLSATGLSILFEPSQDLEAFVEGASNPVSGVYETFNSERIVVREIGQSAKRTTAQASTIAASGISFGEALIGSDTTSALDALGLSLTDSKIAWVDENNPPINISYDELNQRFQFTADRNVLGTGTGSNFNSFTVYGSPDAEGTNGIGIPSSSAAQQVQIRGGEVLSTESFIADGEEVRGSDKRYGITVQYNGDTKSFTVASGSTGETINASGALGVSENQKSSNIQIGRRIISAEGDGSVDPSENPDLSNRIIGGGENALFGFGATKQDFTFQEGRGLASAPAISVGRAAQGDLTEVFRLTSSNNENRFNVSVNGIAGIIDIPAGNYVGTTLASALEERINQITSPLTGEAVGGVTVRFSAADNNFTFTTGTSGETSTIKVKGAARLGLDDVPLGVGSVPKIFNLVQATNSDGIALYVDAQGDVVTTPPESMVDGYYPLYIDEGELTFDKTGKLVSPKNDVRYEQQAEGFSISLDIDYSLSSQFAQPFSVLSVEQDGFTSGRLDGLEIDSSGTIRANYTNGQNNPLGKNRCRQL